MSNPLNRYNVLIADADQQLAGVLRVMLEKMGFSNVEMARNGGQVQDLLYKKPIDFLITEWKLQDTDGISLINQIRRDPGSANPTLPILMLTGRAEQSDVSAARDNGINEYVVKPFSAKAVFNRLENLIERPRQFISAPNFVGPDRRHKSSAPPEKEANRRTLNIPPKKQPKEIRGKLIGDLPKIWTPDFSLKDKLGKGKSLKSFITPAVLNQAQSSINAITADSLQWIKEDLDRLKIAHQKIAAGENDPLVLNELGEVALSINSRCGTFGYGRAAEVAYHLYLFCRNKIQADNKIHHVIIQKHAEVLQVIFGQNISGMGGKTGEMIAMELHNLVLKYAP